MGNAFVINLNKGGRRSICMGSNLDEFILALNELIVRKEAAALHDSKEKVEEWLRGECEEGMVDVLNPLLHTNIAHFSIALEYFHKANSGTALSFKDFAGYESSLKYFSEYLLPLARPHPEFKKKFRVKSKHGMLLYGPPGCGKTYLSKCLAGEMGYVFVDPSPAKFASYEGTYLVPELFGVCRKLRSALLYLDDVDKISGSRDSYKDRLTSAMLSCLDGYNVDDEFMLIASTNYPERIDPAFYRPGRFDKAMYLGLPDSSSRKEIFTFYLREIPHGSLDFGELAEKSEFCSTADIKQACSLASFDAYHKSIKRDETVEVTQEGVLKRIPTSNSSAKAWLEGKKDINFGPFSEMFSDLGKDIERYKSCTRDSCYG